MKVLPDDFNFRNYVAPGVKLIAHWMPWFGGPDHFDVGYRSDDPKVIDRQLELMKALGFDIVCVEYYGHLFAKNKPWYTRSTLHMFDQCQERGMGFCLCPSSAFMDAMVPKALQTDATLVTSAVIELLNYAASTFFPSDAYLDVGSRPVVMWFGMEQFPVNWDTVRAQALGNALFLFRNASGFGKPQSDGAFAWPAPWMSNDATKNLLDPNLGPQFDFIRAAAQNPSKVAIYSAYPGFNDAVSTWRPKDAAGKPVTRILMRRNGLTLLDTLSIIPSTAQFAQICTFNDHEEGSAIEFTLDEDYSGRLTA